MTNFIIGLIVVYICGVMFCLLGMAIYYRAFPNDKNVKIVKAMNNKEKAKYIFSRIIISVSWPVFIIAHFDEIKRYCHKAASTM